jgi:hypothetical protein
MRLMFVYWPYENAGSATDLYNYGRTAKGLGHEVVVYGPKDARLSFDCSLDVGSADAVIFVLEWNLYLHHGGRLNLVRLLASAPRERRIVIDCDGMYNDPVTVEGDCNYLNPAASAWRTEVCDQLSATILQPTYHPLRPNVRPFLFHGYSADWEVPLKIGPKELGMTYVGSNWFRWGPLERVLRAVEPIRDRVGRIALVGPGWGAANYWDPAILPREAFHSDPTYLQKQGVDILPAVHFREVVGAMSKARFNPVIYRPLFAHLRFVTCRTFETFAANTIPLFGFDAESVQEVYGPRAGELILGDRPTEKIADVFDRPDHYLDIVHAVRKHLATHHSYEARLRELVRILNASPTTESGVSR